MNNETIEAQIKHLEAQIKSLQEVLPYADGQAYYNDKREIQRLIMQLWNLRNAEERKE